jgi:1-carboxybiuret hydrolase subunit AtzH-like protein
MSGPDDSRRAFLTGGTVVAASAAFAADASAQSKMVINDPNVVREIEAEFAGYDRALAGNDVAALNGFFFDSPFTIRYGNGENLYGHSEIEAYRGAVVASGVGPKRERAVITTYGNDFATVSTLSRRPQSGKIGRTMQTWVRFPQGWRIVAAHVSTIDEPSNP